MPTVAEMNAYRDLGRIANSLEKLVKIADKIAERLDEDEDDDNFADVCIEDGCYESLTLVNGKWIDSTGRDYGQTHSDVDYHTHRVE